MGASTDWTVTSENKPLPEDRELLCGALQRCPGFFEATRPLIAARAPGRLDLMGGIADYSGSLVLQWPLAVATYAAVQECDEPLVFVRTEAAEEVVGERQVEVDLNSLTPSSGPLEYEAARDLLAADSRRAWAAYAAGGLPVLHRERGIRPTAGLRILIASSVPVGKGVSSSAAIEVAAMHAVVDALGAELEGREMALLCQMVENLVVGAPCGVMDQMTAACGEAGCLLALRCQPAELEAPVPLPEGIAVWGIDSGIRHAVSGADYGSVRTGAFMGYRIIADAAGLPARVLGPGRVAVEDSLWHGCLANIAPSVWEERFRDIVPVSMRGADFLDRFQGSTDHVTRVDPATTYAVRQPAAHPIYEHHRVRQFRRLLLSGSTDEETLSLLGELMFQSHQSYSACGLGSDGTDRLVELVREAGPESGLFGAKITGGGSGGTVAVLGRTGADAAVGEIASQYAGETGRQPEILTGTSPGAMACGTLRLRA